MLSGKKFAFDRFTWRSGSGGAGDGDFSGDR
jgi:hypothetical protein